MLVRKKGIDHRQAEEWQKHQDEILGCFGNRDGLSGVDIQEATGLSRPTIRKHLRALESGKEIERLRGKWWRGTPIHQITGWFPPELKAMEESKSFWHSLRSLPAKKGQGKKGKIRRDDRISNVFWFTDPPMPSDNPSAPPEKFWWLAFSRTREFLSDEWVSDIFRYALDRGLIDEKYFQGEKSIDKISNQELERVWRNLFGSTKWFVVAFSINPKNLLKSLETQDGKKYLKKRTLSRKVLKEMHKEFLARF